MSASEKAVQAPSIIQDPSPYRLPRSLLSLQPTAGRLFDSGRYAWVLHRGSVVYVFKAETGECATQLRLGARGSHVSVSCSCELNSGRGDSEFPAAKTKRGEPLLVLAVHSEARGGQSAIAVINPAASKLVSCVEIPWRVTSLCVVPGGSLQLAGLFSQSVLQHFSGVLVVGCSGGRVLLVDLALGSDFLSQPSLDHPRALVFIESIRSGSVAAKITDAREVGRHACVDITGMCVLYVCVPHLLHQRMRVRVCPMYVYIHVPHLLHQHPPNVH